MEGCLGALGALGFFSFFCWVEVVEGADVVLFAVCGFEASVVSDGSVIETLSVRAVTSSMLSNPACVNKTLL